MANLLAGLAFFGALLLLTRVTVVRTYARFARRPEIDIVDEAHIPTEDRAFVDEQTARLEAEHLFQAGVYRVELVPKRQHFLDVAFWNDDRTLAAGVLVLVGATGQSTVRYISIASKIETPDGRVLRVTTYNAPKRPGWRFPTHFDWERVPDIEGASLLLDHHRTRLAAIEGRPISFDGYIEESWALTEELFESQVERGLMRRLDRKTYGLTWKGACRAALGRL